MELQANDLSQLISVLKGLGSRFLVDSGSPHLCALSPEWQVSDPLQGPLRERDLLITDREDLAWEELPCAVLGVGVLKGDYHCSLESYKQVLASFKSQKAMPFWSAESLKPCLFLDRDNVVVPDVPYNGDPEKVTLNEGIVELIEAAHQKDWWVVLVTNQSGLGRGKIVWSQYRLVHLRLQKLLAQKGQWLDDMYWAGFHESALDVNGRLFANLRKPRPGMFFEAFWRLGVDLPSSWMVGDSATDLMAAHRAGIQNLRLLKGPHFENEKSRLVDFSRVHPQFGYQTAHNLSELVGLFGN